MGCSGVIALGQLHGPLSCPPLTRHGSHEAPPPLRPGQMTRTAARLCGSPSPVPPVVALGWVRFTARAHVCPASGSSYPARRDQTKLEAGFGLGSVSLPRTAVLRCGAAAAAAAAKAALTVSARDAPPPPPSPAAPAGFTFYQLAPSDRCSLGLHFRSLTSAALGVSLGALRRSASEGVTGPVRVDPMAASAAYLTMSSLGHSRVLVVRMQQLSAAGVPVVAKRNTQ